jgi:hypothetical protein
MASFTFVTTTFANVTIANSTKVKVVSNVACYYNINANASVTANAGPMIAANRPTDINMGGLSKVLSVGPVNGGSAAITVTEIGTVSSSAITGTTFLNT